MSAATDKGVLAMSYAELAAESARLDALLNDKAKPLKDRRRYFAPYTQAQQELRRRNDAAIAEARPQA